jgi:hypothetical protein
MTPGDLAPARPGRSSIDRRSEVRLMPPPQPARYLIRVRGQLDPRWSAWFDGLAVTHEPNGDTTLVGLIPDQPALYGLLSRARDLGLTLVAVERREPGSPDPSR